MSSWVVMAPARKARGLLLALRRFGLPPHFLHMVKAIYSDRVFRVSDCGSTSSLKQQRAGICQGCPLSPFLFVAVMTVLMRDAYDNLSDEAKTAQNDGLLYDILYADDTLIVGTSTKYVDDLARTVEEAGAQYGMSLHWGKTQGLSVNSLETMRAPNGTPIEAHESLTYLGALLTADGRGDSEISRRIGIAYSDFRHLRKAWNHANLTQKQKLQFLHALVISKLTYGLCTIWLVKAQQRRLDGFYARCLRQILHVPSAYISRISNASVFDRAGVKPISEQIWLRQIRLLGRVGRAPAGSALRRDTLAGDTAQPQIGRFVRRVGRPRHDWTSQVMERARLYFTSERLFEQALLDRTRGSRRRWNGKFA